MLGGEAGQAELTWPSLLTPGFLRPLCPGRRCRWEEADGLLALGSGHEEG